MALAVFGPGIVIVKRIDIANQAPVNIGYAQELELKFAGTSKPLYGTDQLPLVIARGTIKSTGKVKAAEISGLAINAVFWGQTFASGGYQWNVGEKHTVPAGGGTITVSLGASFDADLGVTYDATGIPFQETTSAPSAGVYSMAAGGVYAFAVADASLAVDITYTSTTAIGQSLVVVNQPIGFTPAFQLDYWNQLNQPTAMPFAVRVYYCVSGSLGLSGKLEDYMMPEIDFDFGALPNGKVVDKVFPNVS